MAGVGGAAQPPRPHQPDSAAHDDALPRLRPVGLLPRLTSARSPLSIPVAERAFNGCAAPAQFSRMSPLYPCSVAWPATGHRRRPGSKEEALLHRLVLSEEFDCRCTVAGQATEHGYKGDILENCAGAAQPLNARSATGMDKGDRALVRRGSRPTGLRR